MTDGVRLGQVRPTRMRRIGERHMIVLPQQTAQLLTVDEVGRAISAGKQQIAATLSQLAKQRAFVADLELQLQVFMSLPVTHDEDDPDVPEGELGALRGG